MGNGCSPGCRWWCLWSCLILCCPFPTRGLGWDLGLNWVSFWGFSFLLLSVVWPFGVPLVVFLGWDLGLNWVSSWGFFLPTLSLVLCLVIRNSTGGFLLLRYFGGAVWHPRDLQVSHNTLFPSSPLLLFIIGFIRDLIARLFSKKTKVLS